MRSNKKGFTLIELIVIIAIIAVLAVVGTSSVINLIEKSKKSVFEKEAASFIEAARMKSASVIVPDIGICYTLSELSEYIEKDLTGFSGSVYVPGNGNKEYKIWLSKSPYTITGGTSGNIEVITPNNFENASTTCPTAMLQLVIEVDGGVYTGDDTIILSEGDQYTLPTVTKEDCVFDRWTATGNSTINGNDLIMGNTNETVTAIWRQTRFALTIITDGSIWDGTTPETKDVGSTVTINEPTKANHEFTGWRRSDNNELITETNFTMPNNDLTLTAEWELIDYVLEIVANGGIWDGITQSHNAGDSVTIEDPIKDNNVFMGWRRSDNNELITETNFTMPGNDLTLTAEWVVKVTDIPYTAPTASAPNPYRLFEVQATGWYKVELWGAQGSGTANGTGNGGKGGYTSGEIEFVVGEKYYIYVGEYSTTINGGYNGGGDGYTAAAGGGGGATDIRYFATTPTPSNLIADDSIGLRSRIMIAAGGGANSSTAYVKGHGGGILGITAYAPDYPANTAKGGSQMSGGKTTNYNTANPLGADGEFGKGGIGGYSKNYGSGGGGGGYYGGGGGANLNSGSWPAGGGSSFISGYAGVNAINSDGTHSNDTRHYSGKYFIDGKMQIGINEGNGKAKITYLGTEKPAKINTKLNNVRYVRDCATGNAVNGLVYWDEIQAIDENGLNVAHNKSIIDTSVVAYSGYDYAKIIDGKAAQYSHSATYNNAQGTNRCVTVDLGAKYNLTEIAVWHLASEIYPSYQPHYNTYTRVSSDKVTWETVIPIQSIVENSIGKRVSAYSIDYNYTGNYQEFSTPVTGLYQIELWGAQGGGTAYNTGYGGKGGYTSGEIKLNAGEKYYIYVGGYSTTLNGGYNGGGNGYTALGGGGGGATDIRYFGDLNFTDSNLIWNDELGLKSRIMVAAGGGANQDIDYVIGHGGGIIGKPGYQMGHDTYFAGGATQFEGGVTNNYPSSYSLGTNGIFGQGGTGGGALKYGSGGGGGGYYGGGGGSRLGDGAWPGGGGSSFISGHTGCVAVANSLLESEPKTSRNDSNFVLCSSPTSVGYNATGYNTDFVCSIHYSEKTFVDTLMIDGAGYKWQVVGGTLSETLQVMPNPNGGYYDSGGGHIGNGYARISYIGAS